MLHLAAPAATFSISGTVFEDIAGDVLNDGTIGDANNPGSDAIDVYLYRDDGNTALDAGDTLVAGPIATDPSGAYSFTGLTDDLYFVRVDSRTVPSAQDPAAPIGDIWATQTYGPNGGMCANGAGSATARVGPGPCYGGITGILSDSSSLPLHQTGVNISGASVTGVDFGFSFNVVVNTRGGNSADDDPANNRTVQGSLRQFIQNADAITGPNAMRFVPVDPSNADDGGANDWWRIDVTSALPAVSDGDTVIDGTASDLADGVSGRGTNALGPELELNGATTPATVDGLLINGGDSTVRNMVVNRFGRDGIRITAGGGNVVTGNYLGTDATGAADLGNGNNGIFIINAPDNQIGSTSPSDRNIVSGNDNNGILFDGAASTGNVIQGNYFGTNAAGTAGLGNSDEGVDLSDSPGNTVGGTTAAARNVISANGDDGLLLIGSFTVGNTVQGNYIGTNAAGAAALPNGANGVAIKTGANSNTIGGTALGAGNVISGNTTSGVAIREPGTDDNTVDGNSIGTDAAGSTPMPNGVSGVQITGGALNNTIGGAVAGNLIAHNTADGVVVTASPGTAVVRNSLHSNGGLGIDLGDDGVTESGVPDFPDITAASETAGALDVDFDLDVPAGFHQIEFFTNPSGSDPTGNGEGESFAGSTVVSHSGSGFESFTTSFAGSAGDSLTATTTECADGVACTDLGSTSELSDTFTAVLAEHPPVFDQDITNRTDAEASLISLSASATDPDVGDVLTYAATGLPLGLAIDSGTGLISGLVNYYAAATSPYDVEITVDDGNGGTDTDTFTWTISNVPTTDPYVVANTGGGNGGDDLLTEVDPLDLDPVTNEVDIGTGTGTTTLLGMAIEPLTGVVYAADGDQLGTLNVDSGVFTAIGPFGSGDGVQGTVTFDAVRGLAFHPLTGELLAVHHQAGDRDLLFPVDPNTGSIIPGSFNAGRDYAEFKGGAPLEVTDIAIDPTDWETYGIFTDGAGSFELRSINRWNGATNLVGPVTPQIRGLSFDPTGLMWGTDNGTLYEIDKTNGTTANPRTLDNGSDYQAVALAVPPYYPPSVEGTIFEDVAANAVAAGEYVGDFLNPGFAEATVRVYNDDGSVPGEPDAGDTLYASKVTGPTGHYYFSSVPAGTYWLTIDSATLSPHAGGSGRAEQTYGPIDAVAFDGSYSFAATAGPLYGGMRPTISDNAALLLSSEHVVRIELSAGEEIEQVDLGFSFNAVTNLEGTDAMSPQGSLRQFITNANSIPGANGMRFVPVVPTNADDGGSNAWWSLSLSVTLPTIVGASTTIEGTAYDLVDGTTVLDPNVVGPDFELDGSGATGASGLTLSGTSDSSGVSGLMINAFSLDGVRVATGADGITISDNWIGSDNSGSNTMGNGDDGIDLNGANATIADNVINHSGDEGIDVRGPGSVITGNYVGLEPDGAGGSGNYDVGIALFADNTTIGGSSIAQRNVISYNWEAIEVNSSGNTIQGNYIGTDATGILDRGNRIGDGIEIQSGTGNLVGGTTVTEQNLIAYNQRKGVDVTGGTGNTVIGNRIHSNGWLGIDLGSTGVAPNDPLDSDLGPNDLLNWPEITAASESGGVITLSGTFDVPAGSYRFEFFTNTAADPSGNGEGETLAGSAVIAHTGSGPEPFGAAFPGAAGEVITATITECTNGGCTTFSSTSEFSNAVTVTLSNSAPVLDPVGDQTIDEGVELTFAATATDPDVPSTLSFTLTGAPAGASIDPVSGVFTWTPSEAQGPGSYPFDIVVTDDGTPTLTDSETITVTVDEVNVAPTVTDPGDQTDPEGAVVSLFITATDSDLPANTLSYAASGLPAGLGIDPVSGEIAGTLSFGCAATSPHTVTVTVTDNGTPILSGQTVFDWTCTPVNQPPTLDPVGDHTINEQTLLTFTATATDPNPGDTLSFTLAGAVPAGAVIDPLSGVFTWTPTETQGPGSYTFDVVVTDNGTPACPTVKPSP